MKREALQATAFEVVALVWRGCLLWLPARGGPWECREACGVRTQDGGNVYEETDRVSAMVPFVIYL